jgi:hypothetical protein
LRPRRDSQGKDESEHLVSHSDRSPSIKFSFLPSLERRKTGAANSIKQGGEGRGSVPPHGAKGRVRPNCGEAEIAESKSGVSSTVFGSQAVHGFGSRPSIPSGRWQIGGVLRAGTDTTGVFPSTRHIQRHEGHGNWKREGTGRLTAAMNRVVIVGGWRRRGHAGLPVLIGHRLGECAQPTQQGEHQGRGKESSGHSGVGKPCCKVVRDRAGLL